MKRILSLLLVFLLCVSFTIPVCASESSADYISLEGSDDYFAVLATNEQILKELSEIYEGVYSEKPSDFPTDVDYSGAYRIYVNTGIQYFEPTTEPDILALMDSSRYVWVIPFVFSGKNVEVTLSKKTPIQPEAGRVLTEEEKAEVRVNEVNWTVNSISLDPGVSLKTIADRMGILDSYDNMVFISGIPGLRQPIILALKNGKADSWIPFEGYRGYPVLEEESVVRSKANGIYDYQTVMEACREYAKTADPDLNGADGGVQASGQDGSKSKYTVLCTGGMLLIVAGIAFAAWKRNKSHSNSYAVR